MGHLGQKLWLLLSILTYCSEVHPVISVVSETLGHLSSAVVSSLFENPKLKR